MKSGHRLVNPNFFKQQQQPNDEVQVFVGKRPITSTSIASSSTTTTKLQQGPIRSSTTKLLEEETKPSSRLLLQTKSKQSTKPTTTRKEPIPPQTQQRGESLFEMIQYLNKQTSEDYSVNDEESFQIPSRTNNQLFRPVSQQQQQQHTLLHVDDLEDSYNTRSDISDQEEESDQDEMPSYIHESPIKKPLPSHRRSLSSRMLPNMGRSFRNHEDRTDEEDSPIIKGPPKEGIGQKRKPPRQPSSLKPKNYEEVPEEQEEEEYNYTKPLPSSTNQLRKLQEEVTNVTSEVNYLKREKSEQTKNHNEKIRSLQDRHTEEIQTQQKRFETLLENKEQRITELQRDNERLRDQLGVSDKSKDGQDTNKLLNDLESKVKSITHMENEKLVLTDQIEKLKYDLSECTRQIKEQEGKIRNKEETINGLSNKIETQEKEIKSVREREFKEINEREKALSMYTESDKTNQQLQEKLKNMEFQSKQIQRESDVLSQKCHSLETTKVQLEKTNDQLRSKLQIMEEDMNHLSQDREHFQINKHRAQQELENCRREISSLHETISAHKNEKLSNPTNNFHDLNSNYSNSLEQYSSSNHHGYNQPPTSSTTNSNYNRKNSNISLSSYSTQGLIGKELNVNSYNNITSSTLNSREPNHASIYEPYNTRVPSQNNPSHQSNQNYRYQQQQQIIPLESSNNEPQIFDTPKYSATTAKVMSMINNRESPKERQHNRNKIMGTSYSMTPLTMDESVTSSQTANIDEQLMQLSLEKTKLEGDMQKLLSMGIKSIAAKKQKMSLELRLEEIEKQSSHLKMRLRNMNY